jgi:antitoxin (DNA-binding transcriptional repressor) of toxin-antitoxin stability system
MEINIYEAKTNLSKLAQLLVDEKEDEIIICKNGSPIVKMTKIQKDKKTKRIGAAKEEMKGYNISLEEFNSISVIDDFYGD